LEQRFRRGEIADWRSIKGVVVLGGGMERYREAACLARRYDHLKVVLAGDNDLPSVLAEINEGFEASRIILERRSRNTYENAPYSAQLISSGSKDHWLLVTSAYHMPRAIGCFRKAGLRVEPWPVYDLPSYGDFLETAFREWAALITYRILGRTSTFFPKPANSSRWAP
jgi:uncharacterized SAM-binding protein YcdF (DUF218 family)